MHYIIQGLEATEQGNKRMVVAATTSAADRQVSYFSIE